MKTGKERLIKYDMLNILKLSKNSQIVDSTKQRETKSTKQREAKTRQNSEKLEKFENFGNTNRVAKKLKYFD